MDTIKAANKIIKEGVALLPDEAKGEFKAQANDIFVDEAIANAIEVVGDDKEKTALLKAYTVQEANRIVTTLWRLQLLPDDMEKVYRELPTMLEVAGEYNEFAAARKEKMDAIMEEHRAIAEEEKGLDIFKGIINGISPEESEKRYEEYQKTQQQAMGAR